jgi:hypothetical protein
MAMMGDGPMKKPPGFRGRNKIAGQFAPRLIEMPGIASEQPKKETA